MTHRAKLCVIFSLLSVLSVQALCRSAPPSPYDPFQIVTETVAYVKIERIGSPMGDIQNVNVRNMKLIRGRPIPVKLLLRLDPFCVAGNKPIAAGADYIVYLRPGSGPGDRYACAWVSKENAMLRDPFVAAAFAEGDRRAMTMAVHRAEEVFRFEGPVPSTPIDQWPDRLPGELTLRWIDAAKRQELFQTRVEFRVRDDGRVEDCSDLMTRPMGRISRTQVYANDRLCFWLKKVARFKPPIFPMERRGRMFWTWPPSRENY